MDSKTLKKILNQTLTFLIIFLIVNFVFNQFFNKAEAPKTGIEFATASNQFGQHELVKAHISNYTDQAITLESSCPEPDFKVEKLIDSTWQEITATADIKCPNDILTIAPGETLNYDFKHWNTDLFEDKGFYKLKAYTQQEQVLESNQFEVVNQSFFGWLWTTLIYQPIYNALVFFTMIIPDHNLGLAIILLTILLRTLLLAPNQKALKSQKKLQAIQPKMAELKKKYGEDQQRIAQETMAIYKEHKVNPFGSCLPLLIQLPILIGLYTVIQNGLDSGSSHLLYGPLQSFDINQVETNFYGLLELTKIDYIFLPIIVGVLQFFQVKLSFSNRKNKKAQITGKFGAEMETANKTMMYIMPVMIAFFTASVPSGVGLYWAFSTIYGIAQQLVVNKNFEKETTSIKVIEDTKDDTKVTIVPREAPIKNKKKKKRKK